MAEILNLFTCYSIKKFVLFLFVGLSGVVVQLSALGVFLKQFYMPFWMAQLIAILIAMVTNFLVNNLITYRDHSLYGHELWRGLVSFCTACSIGMLINMFVASYLFVAGVNWVLAGFIGTVISSVWNYISTSLFTWKTLSKK